MLGSKVAFGLLIGTAVAVLFVVPAQGSAQTPCADLYARSPLEDLTRCADQGHAPSQSALGFKYASGQGVTEDDAEAVRWYRLAAEQGNAGAQWSLGTMYENGDGVEESTVLAFMWWTVAAAEEYASAVESIDIVEGGMSAAQVEEGERLAREWMAAHP
jgi:TPR repeat protein